MSNSELLEQNNQKLAELAETLSQKALSQVPAGGTTDQILAKASDTDYDTKWVDAPSGGGSGGSSGKLYYHQIAFNQITSTDSTIGNDALIVFNITNNNDNVITKDILSSLPNVITVSVLTNPGTALYSGTYIFKSEGNILLFGNRYIKDSPIEYIAIPITSFNITDTVTEL